MEEGVEGHTFPSLSGEPMDLPVLPPGQSNQTRVTWKHHRSVDRSIATEYVELFLTIPKPWIEQQSSSSSAFVDKAALPNTPQAS